MKEVRQTQEIVRLPDTFTVEEAAEYRDALEAIGISCQVANEPGSNPGRPCTVLYVRGDDLTRAQAVVSAHRTARARADKSTGKS